MKRDTEISDEMKEISAQGRQWAREAGYSTDHLRDFFGDSWFDGDSQADRLNNAGHKEDMKCLDGAADWLGKVKAEIESAQKQLRWDAREVYATDMSDRVKDMLVDVGFRKRLDVFRASWYDLSIIKGFGRAALSEWEHWCDKYNKTASYEQDMAEAEKKYEELLAKIRAREAGK